MSSGTFARLSASGRWYLAGVQRITTFTASRLESASAPEFVLKVTMLSVEPKLKVSYDTVFAQHKQRFTFSKLAGLSTYTFSINQLAQGYPSCQRLHLSHLRLTH
jgi:hypothetical protein